MLALLLLSLLLLVLLVLVLLLLCLLLRQGRYMRGRYTFRKVLDVSSECMLNREELSMLVEQRILATLLQPNELHSCLL